MHRSRTSVLSHSEDSSVCSQSKPSTNICCVYVVQSFVDCQDWRNLDKELTDHSYGGETFHVFFWAR